MGKSRVVGYVRVSTAEQVDGFGLDVQRRAIKNYALAHGLRLVTMHADEGISGSNGLDTRRGLAEALAAIEHHEADGLVVYRLDRLARDLLLQETVITRLRAGGASVVSVTEADIDSDDPTRVLVRQVLGSISQYEKALIRGRMMAGKKAKVAAGGFGGGRPAYGWRAEGGELVKDADEQVVVALALRLHGEGLSLRAIGARLEDEGYRPKVGGRWAPNQVRRVLQRAG